MFCVECGREGPLYEGLCAECFLTRNRFTEIDEHLNLMRCGHCSDYLVQGQWMKFDDVEAAAVEFATSSMNVRSDSSLGGVEVAVDRLDGNNLRVHITAEAKFMDLSKREELTTTVRVKGTSCPRCSKIMGSYFESILQVRSRERSMGREEKVGVLEEIEDRVEREAIDNRDLFISRVDELHGGFDVYLSSNSLGRAIARQLTAMHGAEMKESSSLVGKREGKDVYRITFLVRLPAYRLSDIISHEDGLFLVDAISSTSTRLRGLADHVPLVAHNKDLKKARVRGRERDVMDAVVVSETEEELQVLHPVTYMTVELRKPAGFSVSGGSVRVFSHEGELYLVPA